MSRLFISAIDRRGFLYYPILLGLLFSPLLLPAQEWEGVIGSSTESSRLNLNVTDMTLGAGEDRLTVGYYARGSFSIAGSEFQTISGFREDGFLIRSRPDGSIGSALRFAGTGSVIPQAVAVDGSGNIYVGGEFGYNFPIDTLHVGAGEIQFDSSLTLLGGGGFLVKLSPTGEFIWGKALSGEVNDIVCDRVTERLYVTGTVNGTGFLFDTTLNAADPFLGQFLFVAAVGLDGERKWVRKEERGASQGTGLAVIQDGSGDIALVGYFNDTLVYDRTILARPHVNASFNYLLMRLNGENGISRWSQALGPTTYGTSNLFPSDIHVAAGRDGSIYLAGSLFKTMKFGDLVIADNREGINYNAIFVAKVDGDGEGVWVEQSQSEGFEQYTRVLALAVDSLNGPVIGGQFNQTMQFGGLTLTEAETGESGRVYDLFVVRFGDDGSPRWGRVGGGLDRDDTEGPIGDFVSGLAVDRRGNLAVAGVLEFQGSLGTTEFTSPNEATYHLFVASLVDPSLSIGGGKTDSQLQLWPNPTRGNLMLRLPAEVGGELQVVDRLGRIVAHYQVESGLRQLDLSTFPAGIYAIRLSGMEGELGKVVLLNE